MKRRDLLSVGVSKLLRFVSIQIQAASGPVTVRRKIVVLKTGSVSKENFYKLFHETQFNMLQRKCSLEFFNKSRL